MSLTPQTMAECGCPTLSDGRRADACIAEIAALPAMADRRFETPIRGRTGKGNPALLIEGEGAALVLPASGSQPRGYLKVSTAFRDAWVREFGGQEPARAQASSPGAPRYPRAPEHDR